MSEPLCESPVCGDMKVDGRVRVRSATSGARLCQRCLDRLADTLRQLPVLYSRCESILVTRRKRDVERVRGGDVGGITLKEELVAARTTIVSVLASWAGLVVDERPVPARPRRDVPELVAFLLRHLDWLGEHPAAGDAAVEFHEVSEQARSAIHADAPLSLELGLCDRPGCDSTVHVLAGAGELPPSDRVSCAAGHVWRPHEWLLLGHRMEQARRALADRMSVA